MSGSHRMLSACCLALACAVRASIADPPHVVVFKARRLSEVVSGIESTGERLRVSPELAGRRVSLFLGGNDRKEARRQLAAHLGYIWSKDEAGSLLLAPDQARRKLPAKLRTERARAAATLLVRRLELGRRVVSGDESAAANLKRIDDVNGTFLAGEGAREQAALLQFLTGGDFQRLSREGYWVSRAIGNFPIKAQEAVRRWGYDGLRFVLEQGQTEPTAQQIQEAQAAANRDLSRRSMLFQTYGEPDNPAVKGGLVNPLPLDHPGSNPDYRKAPTKILLFPAVAERVQVPVALPMLDRPAKDSAAPALQKRVTLSYPKSGSSGEAGRPFRFEDVLEQLARVTGMNVLADSYQSSRGDYLGWAKQLVDVPLWRVIRQIEYDFWYDCEVRDGWLLFRHRRWPFEEERELPADLLSELDREVAAEKGFSISRLQTLAQSLRKQQFQNLKALYPELRDEVLPYHTLRILASLNRPLRDAAASPAGLPLTRVTLGARSEIRAILRSHRPYAGPEQQSDLRLYLAPSQDEGALNLRIVFAGGDTISPPLRGFYPVAGRRAEQLPPWYRRSWDEPDF